MPQSQNWRVRLAAVKVKKLAVTGMVDDVTLKQAIQGQTIQSGRRFVYDDGKRGRYYQVLPFAYFNNLAGIRDAKDVLDS